MTEGEQDLDLLVPGLDRYLHAIGEGVGMKGTGRTVPKTILLVPSLIQLK